jgi:hypothetical protein
MSRSVPARALAAGLVTLLTAFALSALAPQAHAQFLAPALDRAGTDFRLRQPSLRLVSLGGVYLAVEDENNEINLWDFAGSANGLLRDRDSTSLDLFADHVGRHDEHTLGAQQVETDRLSTLLLGVQAVGRGSRFAGGIEGALASFDRALPSQSYGYEDRSITMPVAIPTLNGRIGKKASWGLRGVFGSEKLDQKLRTPTVQGDEVKLEGGDVVNYPTVFEPVEGTVSTSGIGFGVGYDVGTIAEVAVGLDLVKSTVKASNNSQRRVYETEEKRPSQEWSGTAILTPMTGLRLGGLVGKRTADSDETYRFSLSGGQGTIPLQSRGTRLTRDFEQQYFRGRASYQPTGMSALSLGADLNVRYDKEQFVAGTGEGNFNDFLATLQADSLALPPAILDELQELRHWDAGVGVAYRFSPRVLASVEGHRFNNARDGLSVRARQKITDLRAGVELGIDPSWTARLGAWHRSDDPDVYLYDNERVRNAFTAGVGWAKPNSSYALDAGMEVAKASTDFADPTEGSGSGFRFFLYNRWDF